MPTRSAIRPWPGADENRIPGPNTAGEECDYPRAATSRSLLAAICALSRQCFCVLQLTWEANMCQVHVLSLVVVGCGDSRAGVPQRPAVLNRPILAGPAPQWQMPRPRLSGSILFVQVR
jgi:hypothetical protein